MVKLNFQQSLLESSMPHASLKIILICWFGVNVENSFAVQYAEFGEKCLMIK